MLAKSLATPQPIALGSISVLVQFELPLKALANFQPRVVSTLG